jgi:hypothetical protein
VEKRLEFSRLQVPNHPLVQFSDAQPVQEHGDDGRLPAVVLGLGIWQSGEQIVACLFQELEIHHILQFAATEQGGELVGDDLPQRVHTDAAEVGFLHIKLRRTVHDDIHHFALSTTREPKPVEVRSSA